jgi:hypothetical protein
MMTYSGRLVLPTNDEAPSLEDMARSLERIPRFAGHTFGEVWSVAHHLLVCGKIASRYMDQQTTSLEPHIPELDVKRRVILDVLLHDAHESIIGDIPATWKSREMVEHSKDLDRRIYRSFGMSPMPWSQDIVKQVDWRALLAECRVLGPGNLQNLENLVDAEGRPMASMDDADPIDEQDVVSIMGLNQSPGLLWKEAVTHLLVQLGALEAV